MRCNKIIFQFIACFAVIELVLGYPQDRFTSAEQIQQLSDASEGDADPEISSSSETLRNLYRYERTLSRLRRALEELAYEEAADDMELAEINVFRPLFRYRSQVVKVKNPQQQFG
ncbi:uncharacterized protein LOC6735522 [Drosophila simulans]|uniref:GD25212 n=1 Tax=Drosophila simulans TaxID=7240 RepID=B4QG07_DROSI|nr:uncharacterized protein LOC6735522 [Drosophila simulans]EDX08043.1 GD25212 [Drosophila simulans]KMY95490.1 uncharacterized protein Dsimw501_GD25212 [Drosophila simulans]